LDRYVDEALNSAGAIAEASGAERVRRVAVALAAVGQNGLAFAQNAFDVVRYQQVGKLAVELFEVLSDRPNQELRMELGRDWGYVTPKVDVRAVVFDAEERVLLMQERSDRCWSPPGGWADPLDTPTAAVVREVREETGYDIEVVKLVACYDRDAQGHLPKLPVAVYKLFFLCRTTGRVVAAQELETLDVGWFGLDDLPPLSEGRVHAKQLRLALAHQRDPNLPTDLD
jgi:ADP-ribose pyrophosphatase YjhB (NUDIX family)